MVIRAAIVALLLGTPGMAAAEEPLQQWLAAYGDPSRSVEASDAARDADEPLLIYWMQVEAAPLGIGPPLPGTLVANVAGPGAEDAVQSFTFLAAADAAGAAALHDTLDASGWVTGRRRVDREGGTYEDVELKREDGLHGVVSFKVEPKASTMPDGRLGPTVWMSLTWQEG